MRKVGEVLSDRDIRAALESGDLVIDPLGAKAVQPASVDVRLSDTFRQRNPEFKGVIDPFQRQPLTVPVVRDCYLLAPHHFVLGASLEWVGLSDGLAGRIEGKSSLARLGLAIHSTAGWLDPGFNGRITLEMSNVTDRPIALYHGMKIAQIAFMPLSSPAEFPYGSPELGSKYQGTNEVTDSAYHLNER